MNTNDFSFELPEELIAKHPPEQRSAGRLLVVDRKTKQWEHRLFPDIVDIFGENDILVFNRSKVLPARILFDGNKEIFVSKHLKENIWACMVRPGKAFPQGKEIVFDDGSTAKVLNIREDGLREILFTPKEKSFEEFLEKYGELPLPPYMKRKASTEDTKRYQTVFADISGSVAAPTAGLHFTEEILQKLKDKGVQIEFVTLHVGLGTFLPVKAEKIEEHKMHKEYYEISPEVADRIVAGKRLGKKVTAIGSTAFRTLESVMCKYKTLVGCQGETDLFVYPPAEFKIVDHFFTNFHLPKSTLLMLVSAFAHPGTTEGKELALEVYKEAIAKKYRFFSYGDATLWM